jgi:hypothetical protein
MSYLVGRLINEYQIHAFYYCQTLEEAKSVCAVEWVGQHNIWSGKDYDDDTIYVILKRTPN